MPDEVIVQVAEGVALIAAATHASVWVILDGVIAALSYGFPVEFRQQMQERVSRLLREQAVAPCR